VLLKLFPDQITRYWEDIKAAVQAAVPPLAQSEQANMTQFLENLLMGRLHVWVLVEQKGEGPEATYDTKAFVITTIWKDIGTGARNLLIYALYGYSLISEELWRDGLACLRKFARAENCHQIVAYTRVPRIVEVVRLLGGDTDTRLITLEV